VEFLVVRAATAISHCSTWQDGSSGQ
jgi:hypothetical protein